MIGALLYLRVTSAKNWVRQRITRLRQPKYLLGAIVGAAYFWFFFLRRVMYLPAGRPGSGPAAAQVFQTSSLLFIFVPVVLITVIRLVVAWIAPNNRPGLAFTEAEVAFLFPAPIARRMLVNYKLLSAQVTILLSSVFIALISNRWQLLGGNAFTHAIGWWVIFSTLSLHTTGAAFTVARLIAGGVSKLTRQIVVTGIILLILAITVYTVWHTAPPPTDAELAGPLQFLPYLSRLTNFGALRWVALPFKIVLGPFLATDWREFFQALGPALLLLVAHYVWVMRAETSFEEASVALAEKRTAMIAAMREGKFRFGAPQTKARKGPFPLASAGGRPEVAFLWKNLLSTRPYFNHRTFIICVILIVAAHDWLAKGSEGQRVALGMSGVFALVICGYTLVFGPQFARQDFRGDLGNADLFKSYPLRGWQIVLGELLTPVVILTGILWLGLLTAALGLGSLPENSAWLTPGFRVTAAACLALVAPLLCLLQLMVPNGATLLFPSWAQTTRTRERGIDVMGQRIIFVFGQLLVVIIALIPAALGVLPGFAVHLALSHLLEANLPVIKLAAVATSTVGVFVVLAVEVGLGLWWLGRRFERLDLSSETVK